MERAAHDLQRQLGVVLRQAGINANPIPMMAVKPTANAASAIQPEWVIADAVAPATASSPATVLTAHMTERACS
jgi:hypothetical protein